MKEYSCRKRNTVPIGSREWRERILASPVTDIRVIQPTVGSTTPESLRQFLRQIGRRGGLMRSRNFARRDAGCYLRFRRRYGYSPKEVIATPFKASLEVWQHLRAQASRGGRARARKYSPEQLRAWAAAGGRAKAEKAAKAKQVSSPAQAVAGKQEPGNAI